MHLATKGPAFLNEAEKPVIYCDFKTSNILLDLVSTPKDLFMPTKDETRNCIISFGEYMFIYNKACRLEIDEQLKYDYLSISWEVNNIMVSIICLLFRLDLLFPCYRLWQLFLPFVLLELEVLLTVVRSSLFQFGLFGWIWLMYLEYLL